MQPRGCERAWLSFDAMLGTRELTRLPALPAACASASATDPVVTFEVFWHTYAEHYPFFAAKGIDWRQVGERGRRLVNTHTTNDELFSILCNMIVPLRDAHVALEAKGHHCASPRPGTPDYTGDPALRQRIAEVPSAAATPAPSALPRADDQPTFHAKCARARFSVAPQVAYVVIRTVGCWSARSRTPS